MFLLNYFLGLVSPGILMMCVQFAGCNHIAVVSMLSMALLCGGITMGGFQVNHIDLSPNFAGKITYRLVNTMKVMLSCSFKLLTL